MKRYAAFVWFALGSASFAAPVPKELAKAPKLEGLWEVTSLELLGKPGPILQNQYWRIGDGQITVEQRVPNAAVRVRPPIAIAVDNAAAPKTLDYNAGGVAMRPAIYEIEGDTLKILMQLQGRERPRAMKSDETTILYVFKRVKE